jgi:DDE superfamily endonuclease
VASVPKAMQVVFVAWRAVFSESVFDKFMTLLQGAVLTPGCRTISRILRLLGSLADAHPSSYHRVLSHRRWSMWPMARILAEYILSAFCHKGVIRIVGDETVTEHPGRKVFGKARHRDAKRSSHSFIAHLWGHKWVVLAILVDLPGTTRPWALPILVALYRDKKDNKARGLRHKTPTDLMRQLLCVLLHWFPTRKFVFSGDGAYATHGLTRFARRHQKRLTLISRFHADAALYATPPKSNKKSIGRPRVKGKKQPSPEAVVRHAKRRKKLSVKWYGGENRQVEVVTGTGHWYRAGEGIVEVLWVHVHDLTGTHRDEYFYTTDLHLTAKQVIEYFTGRWSIEVTFQEARAHLGVETTRGWSRQTVLRAEPCLLGLYSVVALWFAALPESDRKDLAVEWAGKVTITYSDAVTFVRRDLWRHWIFANPAYASVVEKLSHTQRRQLIRTITLAL